MKEARSTTNDCAMCKYRLPDVEGAFCYMWKDEPNTPDPFEEIAALKLRMASLTSMLSVIANEVWIPCREAAISERINDALKEQAK